MPLLGQLLVNLFGGLATGLAAWFAKRAASKAIVVAGIVASVTALMLLFNNTVAPLAAQMFSTSYGQFLGLAFPPVAGTCLAAISTCWVGCATYKLRERAIAANL